MANRDLELKAAAYALRSAETCTYCNRVLTPDEGALVLVSIRSVSDKRVLTWLTGICFACHTAKPKRLADAAWMAGKSEDDLT